MQIRNSIKNESVRQYSQLLISTILMIGFQFGASTILTRSLSLEDYSTYKQVINYWLLLQSCITFGIPVTLSYILTNEDNYKKEYIGFGIKTALYSVLFASIFSYALLLLQMNTGIYIVDNTALMFSPFCIIPLLMYYNEYFCIGTNCIKILSKQKLYAPILFVIILLVYMLIIGKLSTIAALMGYIVTYLLIIAFIVTKLGFTFKSDKGVRKHVLKQNRTLGLQTYIGSIFSVISSRLFLVLVAAYVTDEQYAPYLLAVTISTPLGPFMTSLGNVMYKKFASQNRMSKQFVFVIIGIALVTATIFIVGIIFFTTIIFGDQYEGAIIFAIVLGLGSILLGIGDIFNRFIMSKGKGKFIRNCAIATGLVNIILSAILIGQFNVWGITIARVTGNIVYLAMMIILYKVTVSLKNSISKGVKG